MKTRIRIDLSKRSKPKTLAEWRPSLRGQGRPEEYAENERDRRLVERMVKYAIPVADICQVIRNRKTGKPISKETLYARYGKELRTGRIDTDINVSKSLHTLAIGRPNEYIEDPKTGKLKLLQVGYKPDVNAIRWYETTRKGFSEKTAQQMLGKDGQPIDPNQRTVVVFLPGNRRDEREDPLLLEAPVIEHEPRRRKEKVE